MVLEVSVEERNPFDRSEVNDVKETWLSMLKGLDICPQKGLVEMFDDSIGASSMFMPHGGKYQLTEVQSMVVKLLVLEGKTNTVTMMSYDFDPYLPGWGPYHGAIYTVLSSVTRTVAAGGDYSKIQFTFQEYFRWMTGGASHWSQLFVMLLRAYNA